MVKSVIIEACRSHNGARRLSRIVLKVTGIMISFGSKPLIVVDPVMVVLFMRREMVTYLPARF